MKKQRVPAREVPRPVDLTGQIVQLEAVRGGTGTWKLGNKTWADDWLAPT